MVYEIINITAKGEVDFKINLNRLALELDHSEYDPEKFSGLIYRIKNPSATFQIFKSGKFICTGCKNNGNIKYVVSELIQLLTKFNNDNQQKRKDKEKSS